MSQQQGELVEIGALWESETGTLSGKLGSARLLILRNKYKKAGDKTPDFRVFVAKDDRESKPAAPQKRWNPPPNAAESKFTEDDIPF